MTTMQPHLGYVYKLDGLDKQMQVALVITDTHTFPQCNYYI